MSIATELQNYADGLSDAYDAVQTKGGTIPQNKNMDNLDAAIATIPTGGGGPSLYAAFGVNNGVLTPSSDPYTFEVPYQTAGSIEIKDYMLAYTFGGYSASEEGGGLTKIDLRGIGYVRQYGLYYSCMNCRDLATVYMPGGSNIAYQYALNGTFYGCTGLTGTIDWSSLQQITATYAANQVFQGCSNLTGVNLSNFNNTNTSGTYGLMYAFRDCTSLSSADLSSLTTIASQSGLYGIFNNTGFTSTSCLSELTTITGASGLAGAFAGCTALTTVNIPKLSNLSTTQYALENCFQNCTALTTATFPMLSTIKGAFAMRRCFRNCTSLTSVSFPALTTSSFNSNTCFNNMLQGVTGCTVHFPSAVQGTIGSWSDVTAGFGGTNTTVVYDL